MEEKKYVLLWGEHVDLKSFCIGLIIQIILLLITFLIPLKSVTSKLVLGLVAIILGLIINAVLIKPKRNIKVTVVKENAH